MPSSGRPADPGAGGARRLVVFGKRPRPGRVKTRLAPALGEQAAAELYAAFLEDVLACCRAAGEEPELWIPRPETEGAGPGVPQRSGLDVRPQPEGDLGERLRGALRTAFGEGARRAVVVGSDHPTLPADHVREAFAALDDVDACLGPTDDGGYWGVGVRAGAWPAAARLFEAVPWSTPDVLDTTLARAAEADLQVRRLSAWYDVDDPSDLARLRRDVREGSATAARLDRLERRDAGSAGAGSGRRARREDSA